MQTCILPANVPLTASLCNIPNILMFADAKQSTYPDHGYLWPAMDAPITSRLTARPRPVSCQGRFVTVAACGGNR